MKYRKRKNAHARWCHRMCVRLRQHRGDHDMKLLMVTSVHTGPWGEAESDFHAYGAWLPDYLQEQEDNDMGAP